MQENTIPNCVIKNKKKPSATFTSQFKLSDFNPTRKYKKPRDAWFLTQSTILNQKTAGSESENSRIETEVLPALKVRSCPRATLKRMPK